MRKTMHFKILKVVPLWLKLMIAKILLYSFTLEQEIFTVLIVQRKDHVAEVAVWQGLQ